MVKILIISEYIAPVQAIASVRWTKIAKYIKQQHPETVITILTDEKNYEEQKRTANHQRKDKLLEKEMQYFDEYWEVPHNSFLKLYYFLKNLKPKTEEFSYGLEKLTNRGFSLENAKKTCSELLHDIKAELLYGQMRDAVKGKNLDFDIVISTFGPIWTHRVAEYVKLKNPNLIWLADFRDFYASEKDSPAAYRRHKRCTMKHCASADAIVRVLDELETFTPSHVPVYTVPNGFDPQEGKEPQPPVKFSIVYTGTLYGKRSDIGIAHKALCDLCFEGKIKKEDAELIYAGPSGSTALSLIDSYHPKENYLHDCGILPRTRILDLQSSAAILLQASCNSQKEKSLWTGKMYEYMMAQKPILYVDSGNIPHSGPSKNIHYLGGCCYEQCRHEETYPQMKAYILEKYQEWKATGSVSVQQDKEYIEQYSYPHIAEQVWQLIQTQMERRKSGEGTTAQ